MFLDHAMREHGHGAPVEEIQHPVVGVPEPHAQFVDVVAQGVRFRSAKLMAQRCQAFESDAALVLSFLRQVIEPVEKRHRAVLFTVHDHLDAAHRALMFAKLRTTVKPLLVVLDADLVGVDLLELQPYQGSTQHVCYLPQAVELRHFISIAWTVVLANLGRDNVGNGTRGKWDVVAAWEMGRVSCVGNGTW